MSAEIRHIVFDIGKVLIHYDPALPFTRLIPDETERRWFFANVCTPDWNIEQDRGRDWAEAEALLIERHPGHETLIRAFRETWPEMVPHASEESVALRTGLIEAGRDVTLLTNFAADTYRLARQMFPFLDRARGVTVSGEVRLIKPDPRIYDLHTESFALDRGKTLFIDDSPANVAGARDIGWHAVLFTDAPTLRQDLATFGLLER